MSIKKRREVANISQVDLAKEIGVTQGMVSQWENKEFMPRADKLLLLAKILNCTVDELLVDEE